jgi:GNAT superfamily N-acetyltransferase
MSRGEPGDETKDPQPIPTIRTAKLEEVDRFFTHVRKVFYHNRPLPTLLDPVRLPLCDEFFVADCNGEIVGIATLAGLTNTRPPTLDALYVVPSYRGRRVGSRLCQMAIQRFEEAEKTPVFCDVTTRNMHRTIESLPSELKALLRPTLSYQVYGDEWEDRE